jgi:hypothetical protein
MITSAALLSVVIWVIVIGLIYGLVDWFLKYVALAEPFNKWAHVIAAGVAVFLVVNLLLTLVGYPIIK